MRSIDTLGLLINVPLMYPMLYLTNKTIRFHFTGGYKFFWCINNVVKAFFSGRLALNIIFASFNYAPFFTLNKKLESLLIRNMFIFVSTRRAASNIFETSLGEGLSYIFILIFISYIWKIKTEKWVFKTRRYTNALAWLSAILTNNYIRRYTALELITFTSVFIYLQCNVDKEKHVENTIHCYILYLVSGACLLRYIFLYHRSYGNFYIKETIFSLTYFIDISKANYRIALILILSVKLNLGPGLLIMSLIYEQLSKAALTYIRVVNKRGIGLFATKILILAKFEWVEPLNLVLRFRLSGLIISVFKIKTSLGNIKAIVRYSSRFSLNYILVRVQVAFSKQVRAFAISYRVIDALFSFMAIKNIGFTAGESTNRIQVRIYAALPPRIMFISKLQRLNLVLAELHQHARPLAIFIVSIQGIYRGFLITALVATGSAVMKTPDFTGARSFVSWLVLSLQWTEWLNVYILYYI